MTSEIPARRSDAIKRGFERGLFVGNIPGAAHVTNKTPARP